MSGFVWTPLATCLLSLALGCAGAAAGGAGSADVRVGGVLEDAGIEVLEGLECGPDEDCEAADEIAASLLQLRGVRLSSAEFEGARQLFSEESEASRAATNSSGGYDVIVVGGGLVGSVVAAELARRLPGRRVLLLEAGKASQAVLGGKDKPASWNRDRKRWDIWPGFEASKLTRYDVPGNYPRMQCWDKSCPESWGSLVPAFQCKVLGGCGVMNGALMQKPQNEMYADWPAGWREGDLQEYIDAATEMLQPSSTPSADKAHFLDNAGSNFFRTALSKGGYKCYPSVFEPGARIMGTPQVSAKDGVRLSTASLLLPKASQLPNFEMRLETEVKQVLQQGGVASGVLVSSAKGQEEIALNPNGLVVMCAGALNTPRVLLASGITGGGTVGKGVTDHSLISMAYKVSASAGPSALSGASEGVNTDPFDAKFVTQYLRTKSGPVAQYGPIFVAFIRAPFTPGPAEDYDVEVWVSPAHQPREVKVSIVLMRPTCSHGDLRLGAGGKVELSGPVLAGQGCSRDRDIMNYAVGELDRLLGKSGATRIYKGGATNMNHWASSCKLGTCADTGTLRVSGMKNVAVADASLLPGQVWGHPALLLTALGLKSATVLTASIM